MYTLKDYIIWRGDLSFENAPFNAVDNIVFCCVSYVNLDKVFHKAEKESLTIKEIADYYFDELKIDETETIGAFFVEYPKVLKMIRNTKRYSGIFVNKYYGIMDKEKTLQFAAMEFRISDGTSYIAFRGTDDSFVGWKEDMLLAVDVIEAEKEACKYLVDIMKSENRKMRIGGHSKGGHLAIYAALFLPDELQDNLTDIYCNDGPGFMESFIMENDFSKIENKICRYMPEESVVGMLFSGVGNPVVVKSQKSKIMQHTPTNWLVQGPEFVRARKISKFSIKMHTAVTEWLTSFSDEEKKLFMDDLFAVLEASGVENFSSIAGGGIKGIQSALHRLNHITPETRDKMLLILKEIIVS